jgi:hypothetical protein
LLQSAELTAVFFQENPPLCWKRSFTGRGIYMKDSIKYGDKGGKDFGYVAGVLLFPEPD